VGTAGLGVRLQDHRDPGGGGLREGGFGGFRGGFLGGGLLGVHEGLLGVFEGSHHPGNLLLLVGHGEGVVVQDLHDLGLEGRGQGLFRVGLGVGVEDGGVGVVFVHGGLLDSGFKEPLHGAGV
jgi:hypothetical protein